MYTSNYKETGTTTQGFFEDVAPAIPISQKNGLHMFLSTPKYRHPAGCHFVIANIRILERCNSQLIPKEWN